MQKWKTDETLFNCKRKNNKKTLDYKTIYCNEFLDQDGLKDWDSITRCVKLWNFFIKTAKIKTIKNKKILDVGTKDGQFTEYTKSIGMNSLGLEITNSYVKYAQEKNRNVIQSDICNNDLVSNTYDFVFAHHVQGLVSDYNKSYQEMLKLCKPNGYVITLNDIPGNIKKHYCMINDKTEISDMLKDCIEHKKIYFDYFDNNKEFVVILKKI